MAKIAGLPEDLLERADIILSQLEASAAHLSVDGEASQEATVVENPSRHDISEPELGQLSLFAEAPDSDAVIEKLRAIDLMNLTPMQAMNAIFELKQLL